NGSHHAIQHLLQGFVSGKRAGGTSREDGEGGVGQKGHHRIRHAQKNEGGGVMLPARRDELREERNEEQQHLGVGQGGDKPFGKQLVQPRVLFDIGLFAARRLLLFKGIPNQAEAEVNQIGGPGVFHHREQKRRGGYQGGQANHAGQRVGATAQRHASGRDDA